MTRYNKTMGKKTLRFFTLLIGIGGIGSSAFYLWQYRGLYAEASVSKELLEQEEKKGEESAGEHGAQASGGEHGGGHEAKPAAAPVQKSLISLEEIFVNVKSPGENPHALAFQMEVELFQDKFRTVLEPKMALLKNTVIEAALEQPYEDLRTLSGRLYFKESLVAGINKAFHFPLVREIHFNSYFLK
jgi:flagellar basal body-associated protein FliL